MDQRTFLGSLVHPTKKYCLLPWIKTVQQLDGIDDVLLVNTGADNEFKQEVDAYPYQTIHIPEENMFRGIGNGRLELFRRFLRTEATHFFSLECDVFPKSDIPQKMLKYDEPIISTPYIIGYLYEPTRRLKADYLISITDEDRVHYTLQEFLQKADGRDLVEVNEAGMGCSMIRREVVEKYLPLATPSNTRCDDQAFYRFCREQNIGRFALPSLMPQISHYPHFHMEYGTHAQHTRRKSSTD